MIYKLTIKNLYTYTYTDVYICTYKNFKAKTLYIKDNEKKYMYKICIHTHIYMFTCVYKY